MDGSGKDPRCAYIAQVAAALLGKPQIASELIEKPEVIKFANELNVRILQIFYNGQNFEILVNKVANPPAGCFECHFLKINKNEELKIENLTKQLLVSTIRVSSIMSLHSYISLMYAPVLFGDIESGQKENT